MATIEADVRSNGPGVQGAERIMLVEDHKLFAEAIASTLRSAGYDVVGVFGTGEAAVEAVGRERPELVLLDLGLPDAHGFDIGRALCSAAPGLKVLILTAMSDPRLVKETQRLGFSGFLNKDMPLQQFVTAVRAALAGRTVASRRLMPANGNGRSREQEAAAWRAQQLTPRELEVLALLAEGSTSAEIAERLSVSLNTVRTHVQNILTKLQVRSRLEAATFAVRFGIVKAPGSRSTR